MTKQRNLVCKFSQMLKRGAPAWTLGFFLTYKQRSILPPESTKRCWVSLCKVIGCLLVLRPWSSNFETYTTNETTHLIPSTPFHLTQVVMHSCKREEMPMFGQSRTKLPAAASEHHDQDHPYPITSVSSLMKRMLYMSCSRVTSTYASLDNGFESHILHFLPRKKTKKPMAWRCSTNQMIDP